jgi:hypothetical protein
MALSKPNKISFAVDLNKNKSTFGADPNLLKPPGSEQSSAARTYATTETTKKINKTLGIDGQIGLEKVILIAQKGVRKFQKGMDKVLYGNPNSEGKGSKIKKIFTNPLDYGINNIIDDLVAVDFCDIINYTLSNTKISNKNFDPKLPKEKFSELSSSEQTVWKIKKLAYDIQILIDDKEGYIANNDFTSKNDIPNPNVSEETVDEEKKKKSIFYKIQNLKIKFNELKATIAPETSRISELSGYSFSANTAVQLFPQLRTILPSIEDKLDYLNQWTDYRQIPISEYQKILNIINQVRTTCVIIQGISTPADVLSLAPKRLGKDIQSQIAKIQKWLDPAKAIPFLKNLIQSLIKINLIIKRILGVISVIVTIANIVLLLIKIFKKIKKFFNVNPTPAAVVPVGAITTIEDAKELVKETTTKFEDRLSQIAYLFQVIYEVLNTIAVEIELLIAKLRGLIANLEQCDNVEKEIISALNLQLDELQTSLDQVNTFIKNKNNSETNSPSKKIGEYTIQIVTEEVIEENFSLRRRYGIAINSRGIAVVSSTPTYASLDSIIVAEVKQRLSSEGLIKYNGSSDYSILEETIINDVKSYLLDDDINMDLNYGIDNVPEDAQLDPPDNENDDVGIGLNSFFNKLPGGKALRRRIRKARLKNNEEFIKSLKADDPEGKYTANIVKKTQQDTNNLKIEELKEEKKKQIALTIVGTPVIKALAIKKIIEIDKEIAKLKNA